MGADHSVMVTDEGTDMNTKLHGGKPSTDTETMRRVCILSVRKIALPPVAIA